MLTEDKENENMRDIRKTAQKGKEYLTKKRNLTIDEVDELHNIFTATPGAEGFINAIMTAFNMGVAVGANQERSMRKKVSA